MDAVFRAGELVGTQSISAGEFRVRRSVFTGSWVGLAHQRRGTGTAMRLAVLALAFDHLGARDAHSGAFLDNPASLRVSRKLGYRDNGWRTHDREGTVAREQLLVMTDEDWRAVPRAAVAVEGVGPCRALLGAD
jgi:RimJ/RimL family protein N-acetyltransferase